MRKHQKKKYFLCFRSALGDNARHSLILGLSRPKDDAWKKEEDEILIKFYPNTLQEVLLPMLPGRTWKAITWHAINVLKLSRTKEIIQEEVKKTSRLHFGADYHTQTQKGRDKVKKTVQERYGVDNVFQAEEIKKEITKTNLEKFGVENPQQCPRIQEQTRQTNQEKYGVDNPFQMTDRVQAGMLKKHGHKSPLQVPEIKARQQATNIERYGFPVPTQNENVQKKAMQTSINNHGIYHTQCEEIKEKIIQTNLKRYGVTNPAKAEEIKKKIRDTTFAKYGVESFLQIKKIRDKGFEILKKNLFKSKGEVAFLEYLKIFDPNVLTQVEHPEIHNIMDYYLPTYDLWCQYDGDYWHGRIPRAMDRAKVRMIVGFDKVQNEKIPNLIRFWESDIKKAIKDGTILDLIENKIREKYPL